MRPFRSRVMTALVLTVALLGSLGNVVNAREIPPSGFPEDPWPTSCLPMGGFPEDPWPTPN
jgi:hypothetical protein